MSKNILLSLILLLLVTLVACGNEQEPTIYEATEELEEAELKIAVIDQTQIWSDSLQTDYYQNRLTEKLESVEAELEAAETDDLSEVEIAELHDELYSEVSQLREDLRVEANEAIEEKIALVAEEEGFEVVFNKAETRFGGEDITELIIEYLNQDFNNSIDQEG